MKSRALSFAALALLVGLCGWTEVRPAAAQALDAGKPAAQIFSGTCSACHRSPRGLVRNVSAGSLPSFLRQHYTTGNDMAGTMAAYVLGSGGTDRVAEPAPKREPKQEARPERPEPRPEPKQRAKSDAPEVAARNPDQKELSKSAKQRAARKGATEPSSAAKDTPAGEPEKTEAAKPETPAAEPAKAEAAECKVEEPAKQTATAGDDSKPGFALPDQPRQPTALLTLPGFPAPPPEPEPEPVATAAAPATGCDPAPSTTAAAVHAEEPAKEQQKEQPAQAAPPAQPAPAPVAEAPKPEPLRSAVTEAASPAIDIMQEELHAPRPPRTGQQKKRAPPQ